MCLFLIMSHFYVQIRLKREYNLEGFEGETLFDFLQFAQDEKNDENGELCHDVFEELELATEYDCV